MHLEEPDLLQPLTETGTATKTRPVIANAVHPNGKCINLIYFQNGTGEMRCKIRKEYIEQ